MDEDTKAYTIALVYSWLMQNPDYYSTYVAPYTQLRYCNDGPAPMMLMVEVGGHYRRRAAYKTLIPAIASTCKFERLVVPRGLGTPVLAFRRRWDEDGSIIPIQHRTYTWG